MPIKAIFQDLTPQSLLGYIINVEISGAFIDFKATKTQTDKKAERW